MDTHFNTSLAEGYKSKSQIARILTESWTAEHMYCPLCGHPHIAKFPNNRAVADFYCPSCQNEFEQKSTSGVIGSKIPDGTYETFIQRITSNNNPDFFILNYSLETMRIGDMFYIPKYFFVPDIAEKRKPLSSTAKRAGWTGCNILLDKIPHQGRIPIIRNGQPVERSIVLNQARHAQRIKVDDLHTRGWLFDILHCINAIDSEQFSLDMVYSFENVLFEKHPQNHNIRAKIRQQLQELRNRGVITFLGNGHYQKADIVPAQNIL